MTKPPRASETPKRFILRWDGANGCYKVSEPGIGTHEVIFAEEYDKLYKQLSAANAALKEARDKAQQEALQTLADAVMKFAPDLGNQLAERWKDADGSLERLLTFLRSRP